MSWQLGAAFNAVIGASYLAITWLILRGLWRTQQLGSNRLALATGLIFFTCGVHHGGHTLHVLLPSFGIDRAHGLAMREAFTWQMDIWDAFGAGVAVFYLTLRRSYGRLLNQPEMFENAERQRYEDRLEQERASLAQAQAIAKLGSWEIDLRTGHHVWSDEMYRIYGLRTGAELGPDAPIARVHPEDLERVQAAMASAIAEAGSCELSFRIEHPAQGLRVLRTLANVLVDASGTPTRVVGTTQDVTEPNRAEAARREAEERFRVTVDHAPIGVALIDLSDGSRGRLLSVNDALCVLVGHAESAMIEMALTSIIHPDDVPGLNLDLALLGTDERARTEKEVRCLHSDGHIVWVLLSGAAVPSERLAPRYAVFHAMDVGERKKFEGQLQYLADHDALTGLFNRRRFEEELSRTLARSKRYRGRGAVLMIDLDGFKCVNDSLGHSYGDELVTRIGGLLSGSVRETDIVARLGGDEFAVILAEADAPQALRASANILARFQERAVALSENRHTRVTASIGITTFVGDTELSAEELIVEADIAMYEAKEKGKNQASLYVREQGHRQRLMTRQSWLDRLKAATDEGRFELMAQPIVGICANGIDRYELLLRLRGDDGELIPPGTFLYIAERFDLIQEIDRWVFTEASRLLRMHRDTGNDISLSVNMSGKTLVDPRILEDISKAMVENPISPGRLVVEVTETAAIVNIERARHVARGLRELGCSFALDDFGAGFASFYYLKHLEFDYLKIDGEFVKGLTQNGTDPLVVESVVQIARGLGAQTIAEFVGNQAALKRLHELGVDYGQGYYLGRPQPIADILPALTPPPSLSQ